MMQLINYDMRPFFHLHRSVAVDRMVWNGMSTISIPRIFKMDIAVS